MPTFEIGLNDGRTLHIDADDHQSALAGAQHFLQQGQPNTTPVAAIQSGVANTLQGVGNTLKTYGLAPDAGTTLDNVASTVAPTNYQPATEGLLHPKDGDTQVLGYGVGNLPRAVLESSPGLATDIIAAKTLSKIGARIGGTPGALIGGAVGGIGSYALRTLGNEAQARASARTGDPNAEPTAEDKAIAAASTAAQGAVGQVGLNRFVNPERVTGVGLKAVAQAAGKLMKTAGTEAATGGAQDAISQAGTTIGTPGGLSVDPHEVGGAALTSGAAGAVAGTPGLIGDASTATKFRAITPDLQQAATNYANRVRQSAGDGDLSSPQVGHAAVTRADADLKSDLASALKDAQTRVSFPSDASNALDSVQKGRVPTPQDYQSITSALGNDPQAGNVLNLVQQSHVANLVKDTGTTANGKFYGGVSPKVASLITHGSIEKAILGTMLSESLGANALTTGLQGAAYTAGAYGLARAANAMTGARSPAKRFADWFADPSGAVRITAQPSVNANLPAGLSSSVLAQVQAPPPNAITRAKLLTLANIASANAPAKVNLPAGVPPTVTNAVAAQRATPLNPVTRAQLTTLVNTLGGTQAPSSLPAGVPPSITSAVARQDQARTGNRPAFAKLLNVAQSASPAATTSDPAAAPAPSLVQAATAITRLRKSNGATKVDLKEPVSADASPAPETQANGEGSKSPAFAFKDASQLPYYGQEHDEVASRKMQDRYSQMRPGSDQYESTKQGIMKGRMADERAIAPVTDKIMKGGTNADKVLMVELREDMHHSSSRARAQAARDYVVRHLQDRSAAKTLQEVLSDGVIYNLKHKP